MLDKAKGLTPTRTCMLKASSKCLMMKWMEMEKEMDKGGEWIAIMFKHQMHYVCSNAQGV